MDRRQPRDYVPQCDLLNVKANGECGALSNANFGTVVTNLTYDAKTLTGFGKRNFNWEFGTGMQRELLPRMSVDAELLPSLVRELHHRR